MLWTMNRVFIGSSLVYFELNQISLDETVWFFWFNGSIWLVFQNRIITSVQFDLKIFKTEITEPTKF